MWGRHKVTGFCISLMILYFDILLCSICSFLSRIYLLILPRCICRYDRHEEGLWLHCVRYTGPDWTYECPYPDWAKIDWFTVYLLIERITSLFELKVGKFLPEHVKFRGHIVVLLIETDWFFIFKHHSAHICFSSFCKLLYVFGSFPHFAKIDFVLLQPTGEHYTLW